MVNTFEPQRNGEWKDSLHAAGLQEAWVLDFLQESFNTSGMFHVQHMAQCRSPFGDRFLFHGPCENVCVFWCVCFLVHFYLSLFI